MTQKDTLLFGYGNNNMKKYIKFNHTGGFTHFKSLHIILQVVKTQPELHMQTNQVVLDFNLIVTLLRLCLKIVSQWTMYMSYYVSNILNIINAPKKRQKQDNSKAFLAKKISTCILQVLNSWT